MSRQGGYPGTLFLGCGRRAEPWTWADRVPWPGA
jgi:hypothetical protein